MAKNLTLLVITFILFILLIIIYLLRKRKIPIKYALVWLTAILLMLLVVLLPDLMYAVAKFIGFELLSNMLLCIFIAILLFITLILTVMASNQKKKITLLIQEVSILKKEVEDKS